jgi:hypothetical protein
VPALPFDRLEQRSPLPLTLPHDHPRAALYGLARGVHVALVSALSAVDLVPRVAVVYVDQVEARRALDNVAVARVGVGPDLIVAAPEQYPVAQAVALALVDQIALAGGVARPAGALDRLVARRARLEGRVR